MVKNILFYAGITVPLSMPYMASAFGIFLMRQAFKSVPIELVSVSTHWNNFLRPLIATNSPDTRPGGYMLHEWHGAFRSTEIDLCEADGPFPFRV